MDFLERLKATLDQVHTWPCVYSFKFIIPRAERQALLALLPAGEVAERQSRGGNYVAVTLSAPMPDSPAVIALYQLAATIPGIVSL